MSDERGAPPKGSALLRPCMPAHSGVDGEWKFGSIPFHHEAEPCPTGSSEEEAERCTVPISSRRRNERQ